MPIDLKEAEQFADEQNLLNRTKEEKDYKELILPHIVIEIDKCILETIKSKGFVKDSFCATVYSVYASENSWSSSSILTDWLMAKLQNKKSFEYKELANLYPQWDIDARRWTTQEQDYDHADRYDTVTHTEINIRVK